MAQARLNTIDHRLKVSSLRVAVAEHVDPRHTALKTAVVEMLRNPVVARAVARGLRLHHLEKP